MFDVRIKQFCEFRHVFFKRKPNGCPACLISFCAAAASGAPQRRAAHVYVHALGRLFSRFYINMQNLFHKEIVDF